MTQTRDNKFPIEKAWDLPLRKIHGLQWGNGPTKILGLHGWLDNGASFSDLGPQLEGSTFTALDFPGHGLSPKKQGPYYIWEYAMDVAHWVQQMGEPMHIVGHSMGAGVALILGPLLEKLCLSITFIDGFAPLPESEDHFTSRLQSSFAKLTESQSTQQSQFQDWDSLIKARMKSSVSPVSRAQAEVLMKRDVVDISKTPLTLRHDPLLKIPSLVQLTPGQVKNLARSRTYTCQLILGDQGLISKEWENQFIELFDSPVARIPGNHHLHLGENSELVAKKVAKFIKSASN